MATYVTVKLIMLIAFQKILCVEGEQRGADITASLRSSSLLITKEAVLKPHLTLKKLVISASQVVEK